MQTTTCKVTVFGKPLATMTKADADCMRSFLADKRDCQCDDCVAFRNR
jgi:hypothetical protein